tara:strand:- start:3786 stop:4385 length:600 start_codon:yes stop_codon:yes gene_type:complete
MDAAIVVEEFHAVEPSTAITILGTGLGLTPLILAGSEEQHEKFLQPFLKQDGEMLASFAHSEPNGTANWLEKGAPGLQTTAYRYGDEWVVNGEKVRLTLVVRVLPDRDSSYGLPIPVAGTNVEQTFNALFVAKGSPTSLKIQTPIHHPRFLSFSSPARTLQETTLPHTRFSLTPSSAVTSPRMALIVVLPICESHMLIF